jgi:hypothetical protein
MNNISSIEKRLEVLGYRLVERLYPWSMYTVIVGPSNPMWARIFVDLDELENWLSHPI